MILDWNDDKQKLGCARVLLDDVEITHVCRVDTTKINVRFRPRDKDGEAKIDRRSGLTVVETKIGQSLRVVFEDGAQVFAKLGGLTMSASKQDGRMMKRGNSYILGRPLGRRKGSRHRKRKEGRVATPHQSR